MKTYPNNFVKIADKSTIELFKKLFNKTNVEEINITEELNKIISPMNGWFSGNKSYIEILRLLSEDNNVESINRNQYEIEKSLLIKSFNDNLNSLTSEEKEKFLNEIKLNLKKKGIDNAQLSSLGSIGALTAANASGFALYTMASTVVGGVTGLLGITLPFAFYTGMSSFISVVTGPIGWALAAGLIVYKFRDENVDSIKEKVTTSLNNSWNIIAGDYERALLIVSIICSLRIMSNEKIENNILKKEHSLKDYESKIVSVQNENNDINNELMRVKDDLYKLELKITGLKNEKKHFENKVKLNQSEISKTRSFIESNKAQIVNLRNDLIPY